MGRVALMSSLSGLMEKAFDKILPVPKTPRIYHPPPPGRPVSWVPHGQLGNCIYEDRLLDFAREIKAINAMKTHTVKYSSRGWCYLLEGLGKIDKGEFNAAQKAINDCRKIGYLPIDFVAEDQDETRRFQGIHEAAEPNTLLKRLENDVKAMLENLPSLTTDYWTNEQFYLMMCVEKGDILNLFEPVCQQYHVPIINSKGWPPILLRSYIARLCAKAEAQRLKPVLLLFYDHDPAGLKISNKFKEMLEDCERGTGWNPHGLQVERFGLNSEDIERYGLTWIENLKTGSGRDSRDYRYIQEYGNKKCESNALFKNDDTLKAAEQICRNAIEHYYGSDALARFKQKEEGAKKRLKSVLSNGLWKDFFKQIKTLIESFSTPKTEPQTQETPPMQKEIDVFLDNKHYGVCPRCGNSFDYTTQDSGKLVRCRYCDTAMRLRWKEQAESKPEPSKSQTTSNDDLINQAMKDAEQLFNDLLKSSEFRKSLTDTEEGTR
jgi:hypothetical protein